MESVPEGANAKLQNIIVPTRTSSPENSDDEYSPLSDDADSDALLEWRESLSPLDVDIVGDFAGQELFAVHGEALLLYCLEEAKVDMRDGFQILHAVHAIETVLHNLKSRGCNFHTIWFREYESLCVPEGVTNAIALRYALVRKIVIEHLKRLDSPADDTNPESSIVTTCYEFDNVEDDKFQAYLDGNAIHFILCSDGMNQAQAEDVQRQYLSIARHFSTRGYHVGFVEHLLFISSKARTWIISPTDRPLQPVDPIDPCPARIPVAADVSTLDDKAEAALRDWADSLEGSQCISARERLCFLALCQQLHDDPKQTALVAAFLTHIVLLEHCSLKQRSFSQPSKSLSDAKKVKIDEFIAVFVSQCLGLLDQVPTESRWNGYDLMDGRLLQQIIVNTSTLDLSTKVQSEIEAFAKRITAVTGVDLTKSIQRPSNSKDESGPETLVKATPGSTSERIPTVLSFSHPVLDKYLESVHITTCEPDPVPGPTQRVFRELTHWHNAKALRVSKALPPKPDKWARRRAQRFMADTIVYSASLTNASGKNITPEVIVVGREAPNKKSQAANDKTAKLPHSQPAKPTKPKKGAAPSGKAAALKAAQELKDKKMGKKSDDKLELWRKTCTTDLESERDLVKRYNKAARFVDQSPQDIPEVKVESTLYLCNVLANVLTQTSSLKSTQGGQIYGLLWSRLAALRDVEEMSPDCHKLYKFLCKSVGMEVVAAKSADKEKDRRLTFPSITSSEQKLARMPDATTFQLQHCGPYLERGFDSKQDPRVPFNPDAWQVRVLNAIDAKKSLFVVAPTSAGKTFISFYAMRQVLKDGDDGILVYVAPTKALVNQIAAEVQARFDKSYGKSGGKSVWAIHTRDYRINNPAGCQVLVTVPHILQIMLLAPTNAKDGKSWSRRVKRIIFDEVHCIGQAEDGVIWEQLLLLSPCPIIALSATVGNPEEFRSWLEGSERSKGYEFEMIVHSARYSDLRKFVYTPPEEFTYTSHNAVDRLPLTGLDNGSALSARFSPIHPIGALSNRSRGTLDDVSLEARDCLQLWEAMSKHQTKDFPIDSNLDPTKVFGGLVKKADVIKLERALKKVLLEWMSDGTSPFAAVQRELRRTIADKHQDGDSTPKKSSSATLCKQALPLAVDLRAQGALPAIFFSYDRLLCEEAVTTMLDELEQAEEAWKESSREFKQDVVDYEKWQVASEKAKQRAEKKPQKSKSKSRADDDDDDRAGGGQDDGAEPSKWSSFDPNAPLAKFSFFDETKAAPSEIKDLMWPLQNQGIKPRLMDALRRGIAVHHAGMNRKYRQVCEILFRKGYLTVVVATGTLALGINMPCKTVVFFGDTVFLTALNYHQAAGRAGRRGFDLLGNVVFAGIKPQRAYEIMSQRLPNLRGHFPLSTSLVLRLLSLLHNTENCDFAVKAVQSLLSQTRLYLGGPSDQMAIRHHLRFSIEFLRRHHLLSKEGAPLNFAGLVGHLYFTENSAFAFHALVKAGYFHELCSDLDTNPKGVLLEMMLVLSHIFCRIPISRTRALPKRSTSLVFLPDLPKAALKVLKEHNKGTLTIFENYVRSFVGHHLQQKADRTLPYSGASVGGVESVNISPALKMTSPPTLRSPFAALSGLDDEFSSIHDLCSNVRANVFLEESAVPYIPIWPGDKADGSMCWNAYLYDFFKHGNMAALVKENYIKGGDVWFFLKDFSLILGTIGTSFTNLLSSTEDDADVLDVADVHETEITRVDENGSVAEDSDDENGSSAMGGTSTSSFDNDDALRKVLRAFEMLKTEFDDKFKVHWA